MSIGSPNQPRSNYTQTQTPSKMGNSPQLTSKRSQISWFSIAFLLLAMIRIAMALLTFKQLSALLRLKLHSPPNPSEDMSSPSHKFPHAAVRRAARYLPGSHSCLARALTGLLLCRMTKTDAELRLGVSLESGELSKAHAWLYMKGEIPVGYLESEHFKTVARYN